METHSLTWCRMCSKEVRFVGGRGWIHCDGGVYALACEQCGTQTATDPLPAACPRCGEERNLRLHHFAIPA